MNFVDTLAVFTEIIRVDDNRHYYVDSRFTLDNGFETMVFVCNKFGEVVSWKDLYAEWYTDVNEMSIGHSRIVNGIKSGKLILEEGEY